jgi:hypothetical protein
MTQYSSRLCTISLDDGKQYILYFMKHCCGSSRCLSLAPLYGAANAYKRQRSTVNVLRQTGGHRLPTAEGTLNLVPSVWRPFVQAEVSKIMSLGDCDMLHRAYFGVLRFSNEQFSKFSTRL